MPSVVIIAHTALNEGAGPSFCSAIITITTEIYEITTGATYHMTLHFKLCATFCLEPTLVCYANKFFDEVITQLIYLTEHNDCDGDLLPRLSLCSLPLKLKKEKFVVWFC